MAHVAKDIPVNCPICKNSTRVSIQKSNKYHVCCPCGWALNHSKGGDSISEAIHWWNKYVSNHQ